MQQFIPASKNIEFRNTPGDPIQVQMYTLANGLRLFLSVNKDEPRVYTEIAVRVGSKHDPADTTGLAHYFEHMMFKGTDQLGSLDWVKEKAILDEIELLFEQHRAEHDAEKKKDLYNQVDVMYDEMNGPLLIAILYFIFQLPFFKKCMLKYIPLLFHDDYNYNFYGYVFVSVFFSMIYYIVTYGLKQFDKF
jgi:hypothetical protein